MNQGSQHSQHNNQNNNHNYEPKHEQYLKADEDAFLSLFPIGSPSFSAANSSASDFCGTNTPRSAGYEKVETITDTLQGCIYRATVIETGKVVVIKQTNKDLHTRQTSLRDTNGDSYSVQEDIVKESQIMKLITEQLLFENNEPLSKTMVEYIDFFEGMDHYFLVMEDGGQSLFDFVIEAHKLIREKKLHPREWRKFVKYIMWQLSMFVYWLHTCPALQCCHLDISLENILIKDAVWIPDRKRRGYQTLSKNVCVKVCDFGLSELFCNHSLTNKSDLNTNKHTNSNYNSLSSSHSGSGSGCASHSNHSAQNVIKPNSQPSLIQTAQCSQQSQQTQANTKTNTNTKTLSSAKKKKKKKKNNCNNNNDGDTVDETEAGADDQVFVTNKVCGKVQYMAPAIVERRDSYFANKADVWSLGISFFVLAVGAMPYTAPNAKKDKCYKYIVGARLYELLHAWKCLDYVSLDMLHLMQSMLAYDENERFTMTEVISHKWFQKYWASAAN